MIQANSMYVQETHMAGDPALVPALGWQLRILQTGCTSRASWRAGPFPAAAPFWRLYWGRRRCAWLEFGRRRLWLEPQQLVLVAPETVYIRSVVEGIDHLFVHFSLSAEAPLLPPGLHTVPVDVGLAVLLGNLAADLEAGHRDAGVRVRLHGLCAWALAVLPPGLWRASAPDPAPQLAAARASIATRLRDPPTNGELAARAGMHVNAFVRAYRRTYGITPQRQVALDRVEEACHLLAHGDQDIDGIAARCGFCDRYHFSRVFARLRGLPPGRYRRALRAAEAGRP